MVKDNYMCKITAVLNKPINLNANPFKVDTNVCAEVRCQNADYGIFLIAMIDQLIMYFPEEEREAFKKLLISFLMLPEGLSHSEITKITIDGSMLGKD